MRTVSVLLIGSELLDGRVQDTNARFACEQIADRGGTVRRVLVIDDDPVEIVDSMRRLCRDSELLLISGGLGPTSDDCTREALAELIGRPLQLNNELLEGLKRRYAERKRAFDPQNSKQALIPEGAEIIPNSVGTAAGIAAKVVMPAGERELICLPGVPREFEPMFLEHVLPRVMGGEAELYSRLGFKLFGLPESTVGRRVEALSLPPQLTVSYRAKFPEVHLRLKSAGNTEALHDAYRALVEHFGAFVFCDSLQGAIEERVIELLRGAGKSLAVAESCTGGILSAMLTNVPGSSEVFKGGIVSYANSVKSELLGVGSETLSGPGAVSPQCAVQMAKGARRACGSDVALALTGIAGPAGGSAEKPVGTVFIALADELESRCYQLYFPAERDRVRRYAAAAALDLLRRKLCRLPDDEVLKRCE